MLTPTRPFKDTVTGYPNEPSLRIGRAVPKNAVNLAYYYNPTASGSEKVLTAEAPIKTIDHKIEDGYRYLFDQVEADDSMFPMSIYYEDNEGYSGRLGRIWTKWQDETHVSIRNVTKDNLVITTEKGNVPKTISYKNGDYEGTLFFDTADYVVTKTRLVEQKETVKHTIGNFELVYKNITGNYVDADAITAWMQHSKWPSAIRVEEFSFQAEGGSDIVKAYVNSMENDLDGFRGFLSFDKLEYEPVKVSEPVKGTSSLYLSIGSYKCSELSWQDYAYMSDMSEIYEGTLGQRPEHMTTDADYSSSVQEAEAAIAELERRKNERRIEIMDDVEDNYFKKSYCAQYNRVTDEYDYSEINEFINDNMTVDRCQSSQVIIDNAISKLLEVMEKQGDIVIRRTNLLINIEVDDGADTVSDGEAGSRGKVVVYATYEYKVTTRPVTGTIAYNVVVNYKGELTKDIIVDTKEVPTEYSALCHYSGIVRSVTHSYDGQAYYRGSVTKGNSISSISNDELNNELIMYSDDEGNLRRRMTVYDDYGNATVKDVYEVEGEYFYLTKVFKDNIPCFYKYDLKEYLYDYKGPDINGYYDGNSVSVKTAAFKDIPESYKYRVMLTPVKDSDDVVTKYSASLYSSFLSQSTDTFKVTYNAFTDASNGTAEVKSGVTEEIYGYPYMYQGIDYIVETVEADTRTSKISLTQPYVLQDSRYYVSFKYKIKAHADAIIENGTVIREEINYESHERTAGILNIEYAAASELNKFEERAYIISDKKDGVYLSPADMIFMDMSEDGFTMNNLGRNDKTLLYTAEITFVFVENDRGGINLKCSPDGEGLLTAETTINTGFFENSSGDYTGKLTIDAPYLFEGDKIYPGVMVKFVDSRNIFVKPPRNDGLLESWYPLIQFGHYSQEFNQNGSKMKIAYSMPEYDNQYYSSKWGRPYVDIYKEPVEILNPHMVKTKCYPLLVYKYDISGDPDVRFYNGYIFKMFKNKKTYTDALNSCKALGGTLAMPKDSGMNDFITDMAKAYDVTGVWLDCEFDNVSGKPEWSDGTIMPYSNYANDNIPNSSKKFSVLKTEDGKWYASTQAANSLCNGYICQIPMASTTIRVYKRMNNELLALTVKDISYKDGIIILEDSVSDNDDIIADYIYVEENYVYRGFWRDMMDFARIDLNPNIYHTYNDMRYVPSVIKPSKNLFNSVIYFFLRPSIQFEYNNTLIKNENCLYHKIDDFIPDSDMDIYIGSVYIRQNTSLHSTVIVDSRTRGGGILTSISEGLRHDLEPESDYYLDIGYYDGKPYQENGVIIVKLDRKLLKDFGGRFTYSDIENKVHRWLGYGVFPIIEYVDAYAQNDLPNNTLKVETVYANMVDIVPEIYLECVDI